jgi:hypothetical protein
MTHNRSFKASCMLPRFGHPFMSIFEAAEAWLSDDAPQID